MTARKARAGLTMAEVLVSCFVMGLLTAMYVSVASGAVRSADRDTTSLGLTGGGRTTADEVTYQLRAAEAVKTYRYIGGRFYVSDGANVVLTVPAFNLSRPEVFLPNTFDYVALRYDSQRRTLTETTEVRSGSQRTPRSEYVLARNVSAVRYTYWVRDAYSAYHANATTFSRTLSAPANAAPVTLLNGVAVTPTYNATTNQVSVSVPAGSSDVQFLYPLKPGSFGYSGDDDDDDDGVTNYLSKVTRVDVEVEFRQTDSRGTVRTHVIQSSANLRSQADKDTP